MSKLPFPPASSSLTPRAPHLSPNMSWACITRLSLECSWCIKFHTKSKRSLSFHKGTRGPRTPLFTLSPSSSVFSQHSGFCHSVHFTMPGPFHFCQSKSEGHILYLADDRFYWCRLRGVNHYFSSRVRRGECSSLFCTSTQTRLECSFWARI
jgi:hypothetical protein